MPGFGRRRERREDVASTFVEATGGGWDDGPNEIPVDGGAHADYVGEVLKKIRDYAAEHVGVGESFTYTITDIPVGIESPFEIVFGLMMRANDYGLQAGAMANETAQFIRLR